MPNLSPLKGLMLTKQAQHQADITNELITGIETSAVIVLETPRTLDVLLDDPPVPPPCIILCPAQQGEEIRPDGQAGGVAYDEIGYPIQVVMIDRQDPKNRDNKDDWRLQLRRIVMRRHREQATTVADPATSFHSSKVTPGPQLDHLKLDLRSIWVSAFIGVHYTREPVTAPA